MSDRIVWSEGMALSPHHLQQSELFFESNLQQHWQALSPYLYGLMRLELETDALENGVFSIRECAGVFPDGAVFAFPQQDGLLEPRPFDSVFPSDKETLSVFLAVPSLSAGGANLAQDGRAGRPMRYQSLRREVGDLNTGTNVREIEFARQNLRILFEGEAQEGLQVLPVAELRRDAQGRVELEPAFIPACVRVGASRGLMGLLKRLIDLGTQKSNHLMAQRAQKASGVAQFTAESLTNYLLLSAVNASLPGLVHVHAHPSVHPEALFRQLLQFAGSLLSFGNDQRLKDLPTYQHRAPGPGFHTLSRLIETLLGSTVPTGYKIFPLIKTSPVQYVGNLREADFSTLGQFYLGVAAQASEVDIINSVQRKGKVGPVAKMEMMVNAALPGLTLLPEANPPQSIPAKAGFKYFRLQQNGELWSLVEQGKSLAIHLPNDLPSTRLELIATMEKG